MLSLKELKKLKENAQPGLKLRKYKEGYQVVVGMATCGISAGARTILTKFVEEVANKGLENVTILQKGCIGECALEPIVEVIDPSGNSTTYGLVTPKDVLTIIEEHIIGGKIIEAKTIENLKN